MNWRPTLHTRSSPARLPLTVRWPFGAFKTMERKKICLETFPKFATTWLRKEQCLLLCQHAYSRYNGVTRLSPILLSFSNKIFSMVRSGVTSKEIDFCSAEKYFLYLARAFNSTQSWLIPGHTSRPQSVSSSRFFSQLSTGRVLPIHLTLSIRVTTW